ncbi:MAG: polyketide cyclase, partial [Myxococcota bacterium]|nr:polyketide cyclase [Myxococcota bacterium]
MKKVLLGIAGMLLVTAGAVAVAASMQPGTTHVERSVTVMAGAVDLEPHIADFTNFVNWSPWTGLDPEQVSRFSDPPGGPGAWYSWEGNRDVGSGRMDLTVHEAGRVTHHLTFIEPFPAEADAHFLWSEVDGG